MLVLASDNTNIYSRLQSVWRMYMHTNPHIDCYFYKGDPNLETDSKLDDDTLWIKIEENLDNVYEKTIRAFEYFSDKIENYDYIFRTNLSSFVVFDKYVEYCSQNPRTQFVSGYIGKHEEILFPSGCGFTMSTDIVLDLIRDRPPIVYLDDVSIGKWLMIKNIPILPADRVDLTNNSTGSLSRLTNNNTFHYRIKNDNREIDFIIHYHLLKKYYNA